MIKTINKNKNMKTYFEIMARKYPGNTDLSDRIDRV